MQRSKKANISGTAKNAIFGRKVPVIEETMQIFITCTTNITYRSINSLV